MKVLFTTVGIDSSRIKKVAQLRDNLLEDTFSNRSSCFFGWLVKLNVFSVVRVCVQRSVVKNPSLLKNLSDESLVELDTIGYVICPCALAEKTDEEKISTSKENTFGVPWVVVVQLIGFFGMAALSKVANC